MSDDEATTRARRRVVVTQRLFGDDGVACLRAGGCEVVLAAPAEGSDGDLAHEQLVDLLRGAQGWIVGHARVTRELLAALPELAVVSRRGVGHERVDIAAVAALGKVATISAGANAASVADHALALMLALGRRLNECRQSMGAGRWAIEPSRDLTGKTVGIVGLGRIGRAVIRRLRGFDVRILVATPHPDPALDDVAYTDFATLLRESDVVSLHAPLTPATARLIDAAALGRLKPTAILVNTARGGLVDDRALLAALKAGRLAGAGLDVFESEADPQLRPVTAELVALPNVVATPHAAASSHEGLARMNLLAARNVLAVLDGGSPPPQCVVADGRSARA